MNKEFAEPTGMVTPAGHRSELKADRAARQAVRQPGRGPVRTHAYGGRLHDDTRQGMEHAFGADLSAVRVRISREVDEVSDLLQAHAFAIGRDVYVRRAHYRAGDELLAHELAHTVQRAAADRIGLKRHNMHLDFVLMTRAKIQFGRMIRKKLGLQVPAQGPEHGTWGHFWTEVGKLDRVNAKQPRWQPTGSYGLWPSGGVAGPVGAPRGVQGEREGQRFWVRPHFEKEFGRPYRAAQPGAGESPDVERGREGVNDSLGARRGSVRVTTQSCAASPWPPGSGPAIGWSP
jgi:hypothetical protein